MAITIKLPELLLIVNLVAYQLIKVFATRPLGHDNLLLILELLNLLLLLIISDDLFEFCVFNISKWLKVLVHVILNFAAQNLTA